MSRQTTTTLITALYPRLSHEDELSGESNSMDDYYCECRFWDLLIQKALYIFGIGETGSPPPFFLAASKYSFFKNHTGIIIEKQTTTGYYITNIIL